VSQAADNNIIFHHVLEIPVKAGAHIMSLSPYVLVTQAPANQNPSRMLRRAFAAPEGFRFQVHRKNIRTLCCPDFVIEAVQHSALTITCKPESRQNPGRVEDTSGDPWGDSISVMSSPKCKKFSFAPLPDLVLERQHREWILTGSYQTL